MKKLCVFLILLMFIQGNATYTNSDASSTQQFASHEQSKRQKKSSSLSLISTIGGISTILGYVINVKFLGGSTFFLIFGILRHIFTSKANQSDLARTQSDLNETQRRVGNIENQMDLQLETIKNEIDQLKDILSKINESMMKQTENTEYLKEEVGKIYELSGKTDAKVVNLEESAAKMTHLIENNSSEINLQKDEIVNAKTILTNLSKEIIELKQFDVDHKKAIEAFTKSMELNSQTIDLFNENIGKKIEEIKDDSGQINHNLRNLVEKNQNLENLAREQYDDTKQVVLSLEKRISVLENPGSSND